MAAQKWCLASPVAVEAEERNDRPQLRKRDLSRHEIGRVDALADNAVADKIVFDESRAGYVTADGRLS